jgi:predicted RNA-binding protein with EMAP domain
MPVVQKTQLKGWRRRWQNQCLDRDRRIEKELQNLRQPQALGRIEEMRYLESCIQELLRELGDT